MLWKCAHLSLPVRNVLVRRKIIMDPLCEICQESDETILHVFRDCHVAHSFWLDAGLSPSNSFFLGSNCMDWLNANACNKSKVFGKLFTWNIFFLFSIWNLWIQRNKVIFQHTNPNPRLASYVEKLVMEFVCCIQIPLVSRSPILMPIRWEKPSPGWVKLNTDGSSLVNLGIAGSGGLIRNSDGDWIMGFVRNIGTTGSVAAELWALRDGLSLCVQLRLLAVEIELDAKSVVSIFSKNTTCSGDLSPLIDDCRALLRKIPQTKMIHCFREANFCADALAKRGTTTTQDFVMLSSPPNDLLPLLNSDIMGLFCNRQCNVISIT
uniref:Uncharacterized protein n=1 Tax=Fagus sylvatica TaxID=28930 RepID=A0A2N9IB19_FAGSY